jgi:hypothetical protein
LYTASSTSFNVAALPPSVLPTSRGRGLGARVQGFEFWVLGRAVQGAGFGVWVLGFVVWGSGFGVWGSGFRVWGLGAGF